MKLVQDYLYKTEQGDTWDLISFKLFGNEKFMKELLEANIELSEFVIFPAGIELTIPEISKQEKEGVAPWLAIL